MHHLIREAAIHHRLAAESHRNAADSADRGDSEAVAWHTSRALQCSDRAYELARQAQPEEGSEGNWQ